MNASITQWILGLTKPKEALSGMPICPYARQAYLSKAYDIKEINYSDVIASAEGCDLLKYQVVILCVLDYLNYTTDELVYRTKELNDLYNSRDIVVLDNDPRTPLFINGVKTTYDDCYLWILQPLADLNEKSKQLAKTQYYSHWTQEQLDDVVTWRFDIQTKKDD